MNKINLVTLLTLVSFITFSSCKKGKNAKEDSSDISLSVNVRKVLFEISGNFTGKLHVSYTSKSGAVTSDTVSSFPWIKQIEYPKSVLAVGIGGNSLIGYNGGSSQKLFIKIRSNNAIVKIDSASSNSSGFIALPLLGYTFPY